MVDVIDQADLLGHEVDGSDSTSGDSPGEVGDVEVDVGGRQHRCGSLDTGFGLETLSDSLLALLELAAESRALSKAFG